MRKNEQSTNSPQEQIILFLDERIESCEGKRKRTLLLMNILKFIRIVSGVLAVLFVALLAADGFKQETKFMLNLVALICTSLAALSSDLATEFGFEKRFSQNVRTLGRLRSIKSKIELEITLLEPKNSLDYRGWHKSIIDVLEGQSVQFDVEFEKVHKLK